MLCCFVSFYYCCYFLFFAAAVSFMFVEIALGFFLLYFRQLHIMGI